ELPVHETFQTPSYSRRLRKRSFRKQFGLFLFYPGRLLLHNPVAFHRILATYLRNEYAGGGFRSITEQVDTTTPARRMMLQMLGAFAEFERSMIRERTRMGLQAARERGRIGGRKSKLKPNQRAEIVEMVNSGTKSAA